MKKIFTLFAALISLTSLNLLAREGTTVFLKEKTTFLGYGEGAFPNRTIKSPTGEFQIILPNEMEISKLEFSENFDSMCEIDAQSVGAHSFTFIIGPASAESARCTLNFQLSNGNSGQIIGIFSSGE